MVQQKKLVDEVSGWLRIYNDGSVDRTWTGPPEVTFMIEPVAPHEQFIEGVAIRDVTTTTSTTINTQDGSIHRARLYLPEKTPEDNKKLPILLHFQGGGFCISETNWFMYYHVYTELVRSTRSICVSPYIRRAPEHRLPAAIDDGFATLQWLQSVAKGDVRDPWLEEHGDFDKIFLIGDSSGGNIVHEVAARAGSVDLTPVRLAGAIPIHPGFVRSYRSRSEIEMPQSPFLTLDMLDKFLGLALPIGSIYFSAPSSSTSLVMEQPQHLVDQNFPLFKPSRKPSINPTLPISNKPQNDVVTHETLNSNPENTTATFSDLGLSEWAVKTCKELGMKTPRRVQQHCIPQILAGRHVIGIDETGSGKTAAFALPILQRLAEHTFGVFALVVTPTRELAFQLAEQFRALGSSLRLRIAVVVGGMDMLRQTKELVARPHLVIATPGRIKVLLKDNPEIAPVFARTKFLVLDEADRVLDVGFQDELKFIFQCLPENRQNLFFSATTTSNLQKLRERYQDKLYAFEAYEGFKTVENLKQQVVFIPKNVKDVYLLHILSKMEDMGIRSAIVFVSTCRDCHRLNLMLEVLDQEAAALYSFRSQAQRLEALHDFKSGKVPVLLATDVAGRGLDIPTVDLVINYDVPRFPRDYIHRVGRTARAGRGGLALSLVTQNDVDLIREIETLIERQLEMIEYKENEVLSLMKKVFSAKNVAKMKMMDDGFEEKAKERKKQKLKMLEEKGLLKQRSKRKRNKEFPKGNKQEKVELDASVDLTSLKKRSKKRE